MTRCPICANDSLIEGERCDVGFGMSCAVQIEPDYCLECFYVQAGNDPTIPNYEFFEKCWELQIDPNPPTPVCHIGEVDPKYLPYFITDPKQAYGNCHKQCLILVNEFPQLKIVMGFYADGAWGMRDHFWCLDGEIIIDPTESQFPCPLKLYTPTKFISKQLLEETLNPKPFGLIM